MLLRSSETRSRTIVALLPIRALPQTLHSTRAASAPGLQRIRTWHTSSFQRRFLSTSTFQQRSLSTTGRSAADTVSDALADANLLLNDLVDDDDRESEDFLDDLAELREAYATVVTAYESALSALTPDEQTNLKKNLSN